MYLSRMKEHDMAAIVTSVPLLLAISANPVKLKQVVVFEAT